MSVVKTEDALVLVGAVSVVAAGANHGLLASLDWQLTEPPVQTSLASLWTVRIRSVQACPMMMMRMKTMMMMINNTMYCLFFCSLLSK